MTKERRTELLNLIRIWKKRVYDRTEWPVREFQELAGKLQFLRPQLTRILLYLGPLYEIISRATARGGQRSWARAGHPLMGMLMWCQKEIRFNSPLSLRKHAPQGTLTTDASEAGYGAVLVIEGEEYIMWGTFDSLDSAPPSSNQREILAVMRAIQHFLPTLRTWRISTLTLESDNQTTIFNIAKIKTARGPGPIVRALFSLLTKYQITLIPVYKPGILNIKADALSRLEVMGDYEIRWERVQETLEIWGIYPSIDLFATRINHKLPNYVSADPHDKEAQWTDAWAKRWSDWKYPFIHTTPALIPRCLQRLNEEGIGALLIAPMWPSQIWWNTLKKMTICQQPLGLGPDVLIPGAEMKRRGTKLPPGWITLVLTAPIGSRGNEEGGPSPSSRR
jgi:hypothetical protein